MSKLQVPISNKLEDELNLQKELLAESKRDMKYLQDEIEVLQDELDLVRDQLTTIKREGYDEALDHVKLAVERLA